MILFFVRKCAGTHFCDRVAIPRVGAEITLAFTQPQPSTQEMNDEHADVLGNRRDR
jgi:hypothetical protein